MKKSNFKKECCKTSGGNLKKSAGKKNKKSEWFSEEILKKNNAGLDVLVIKKSCKSLREGKKTTWHV